MLIDDGEIQHIGDPDEVGRRLPAAELRGAATSAERAAPSRRRASRASRLLDAWLEDGDGERVDNVEHGRADPAAGSSSRRCATIRRPRASASCIANADGVGVFGFGAPARRGRRARAVCGRRAGHGRGDGREPARRRAATSSTAASTAADAAASRSTSTDALDFVVYGGAEHPRASSRSRHEVEAERRPDGAER